MTYDNKIEWTKVELSTSKGGAKLHEVVTVSPKQNIIQVSNDLWQKAGWTSPTQRVDLFSAGNLFRFEPAKAGCITFKECEGTGKCAMRVYSQSLFISIVSGALKGKRPKGRVDFDAWVDGNAVVFRYAGEDL